MLETAVNSTGFITTIELNPAHVVYAGHFPGQPVTPGVIQLQIVHELLENQLSRELKLITIAQCKFLKILNPNESGQIVVYIEMTFKDELLNVKARGESGTNIFFKLNSVYKTV